MPRWDGFREQRLVDVDGRLRVRVLADFRGTDDDPTPVAVLQQSLGRTIDHVYLEQGDLEWLRDEAIPTILERMEKRP